MVAGSAIRNRQIADANSIPGIRSGTQAPIHRNESSVVLEGYASESTLKFRVYGLPAPQGSKRHVGHGRMVEASKRTGTWRQDVKHATHIAYRGDPITVPVSVSIKFWFLRPQSHYKTKDGQPTTDLKPNRPTHTTSTLDGDIDKLCRATLDGLSQTCGGNVLKDDNLVVTLSCEKCYVLNGNDRPGAEITVSTC